MEQRPSSEAAALMHVGIDIERRLARPWPADEIETIRVDYLERKGPERYAQEQHDLLQGVARNEA